MYDEKEACLKEMTKALIFNDRDEAEVKFHEYLVRKAHELVSSTKKETDEAEVEPGA